MSAWRAGRHRVPDVCDVCAGSDDTVDTDSDGVPDGDVDLTDHADFAACVDGPDGGLGTGYESFDFDDVGDNDLLDLAAFQEDFTG